MRLSERKTRGLAWPIAHYLTVALCFVRLLHIGNANVEPDQTRISQSSLCRGDDWFGAEVVFAEGPFGPTPYDDPESVLGMPATEFYDPLAEFWGGTPVRRVKVVEGACYTDSTRTQKLVTTFGDGATVVVRLGRPVRDDPAHPYGIDFIVFGNSFFTTIGFADDNSDFGRLMLAGGCFCEPLKVSVSPGYVGLPRQSATDWRTWDWYTYEHGPYADCMFPTQAYCWDRTNKIWIDRLMDFRKPVNPALQELFESASATGLSVADALELYDGSGGGTGFDLRETGFEEIRYVKIQGGVGTAGGEVDAVAAVRPMVVGDSLVISPANVGTQAAKFTLLNGDGSGKPVATVEFKSVNTMARVFSAELDDSLELPLGASDVLMAIQLGIAPVISNEAVLAEVDAIFHCDSAYRGTGEDLDLLAWTGSGWASVDFAFDTSMNAAIVKGLRRWTAYVLVRVGGPMLGLSCEVGRPVLQIPVRRGWVYKVQRTTDLKEWNVVESLRPTEAKLVIFEDPAAPAAFGFYRVMAERSNVGQNSSEGAR